MVTKGLLIRVEAKPDKVSEVEATLTSVLDLVQGETGTVGWFALRLGPTTFGVFDAFVDETARQAHLDLAREPMRAAAAELFAREPAIENVDVLAAKLPGQ